MVPRGVMPRGWVASWVATLLCIGCWTAVATFSNDDLSLMDFSYLAGPAPGDYGYGYGYGYSIGSDTLSQELVPSSPPPLPLYPPPPVYSPPPPFYYTLPATYSYAAPSEYGDIPSGYYDAYALATPAYSATTSYSTGDYIPGRRLASAAGSSSAPDLCSSCRYDADFQEWVVGMPDCHDALYAACDGDDKNNESGTGSSALKCMWLNTYYHSDRRLYRQASIVIERAINAYLSKQCPPPAPCDCASLSFSVKDNAADISQCCRQLKPWCMVLTSDLSCEHVHGFCLDRQNTAAIEKWVRSSKATRTCTAYRRRIQRRSLLAAASTSQQQPAGAATDLFHSLHWAGLVALAATCLSVVSILGVAGLVYFSYVSS